MIKPEFKRDDLTLISSADLDEICKPLIKNGITIFTYLKNFDDGSQINLSNNGLWLEHYYKYELYKTSLFEYSPETYKSGFLLWPTESNLEVLKHGRTYFDSDNGITVIEQGIGYSEFYFFSGSTKDPWLVNFYVNNLDFLKKFILLFKEKLEGRLKILEKNRIIIPKHYRALNKNFEKILMPILKENIHINTALPSLKGKSNNLPPFESIPFANNILSTLTKRELDIASCLLKGKTAKETGRILFISPRTVEQYLENMKEKFNCKNKFQLANMLATIFGNN